MKKRASVAMAVYNGEKYLREQIDSILEQLSSDDELVISYNKSSDNTWSIINSYTNNDERVKIVVCERKGVIDNFSSAIKNCHGKYILLSDQDDIWTKDKLASIINEFNENSSTVILHDTKVIDGDGKVCEELSLFDTRKASTGIVRNIVKNSFQGSCMAFRSELKPYFLPIPLSLGIHDCWIGIIGRLYGKVTLLDKKLLLYRRHDNNLSLLKPRKISVILVDRMKLLYYFTKRIIHLRKKGHKFGELK